MTENIQTGAMNRTPAFLKKKTKTKTENPTAFKLILTSLKVLKNLRLFCQ